MMKAIFHYDAGPLLQARFAALRADGFDITPCPEADEARLATLLPDADVLLHVLKPATASTIARAPHLRLIQKIGVGVNTIDLAAARARGIAVANMPGTNTPAVAEAALLLMLAALRNLTGLDRACRAGRGWAVGPDLQERAGELRGRMVGLIGAGMVPRALVPVLQGSARGRYTGRAPSIPNSASRAMSSRTCSAWPTSCRCTCRWLPRPNS
jgi:phosphoglycerate dehydrogenase-like enzyme